MRYSLSLPIDMSEQTSDSEQPRNPKGFFSQLGPGLITGAADDDPSGISTYSVAGASFGFGMLWTAILSFPLMSAVQLMCARLGMVTGLGLGSVIRRRYNRYVLWFSCMLLIVANVVNIGADLKGMGEAMEMMTGISHQLWLPAFAIIIVLLLVFSSYRHIVKIFKWLTIVLFAYVITAFMVQPDWGAIISATFVPRIELNSNYLATFLAILGTTISPYLFFWQAAQEVEEEREMGRTTVAARKGASNEELRGARTDVLTGMGISNLIMFFIILTTGATLHASGHTNIETAREAAEALRPLAGNLAYLLFTVGIIGTGMLGVPVLAGSAAYAVAEGAGWHGSLNERPKLALKFYIILAASVIAGLLLDLTGISAVRMLFLAAVVNGVLAPPLIAIVTLLSSDPKVMGDRTSSPLIRWLGWITVVLMSAAAIAMFVV